MNFALNKNFKLDRRIIYLLVALALSIPLIYKYSLTPARMHAADLLYDQVNQLKLEAGNIAFVSLDWGPSTIAENGAQSEVVIEHLLRKRVPFALFSTYALAESYLDSIPEKIIKRLTEEFPDQHWEYGKDWVNLGYKPGAGLLLQSLAKSENLVELFNKDANGTPLNQIEVFKNVKKLENISFLAQFTGLQGVFDMYVQFFQKTNYKPVFGHGCTSITIPEAFVYLDSGQISGLLEGIAGAAWYSQRLSQDNPKRSVDQGILINTGLGVAHLIIILLIIAGNLFALVAKRL